MKYLIPALILILGLIYFADAADTGATNPGTVADDSAVGTVAWSNTTNATASDDSDATAETFSGPPVTTHYLKATSFGFAIPDGATIDGISVHIERSENGPGADATDAVVSIVKADASIGATNKADTVTEWPTTDAEVTYGGASDLWDETWSPADINDADFGAVLSATFDALIAGDAQGIVRVDHISITVYYTEAAAAVAATASIRTGSVQVRTGSINVR